jgi:hypothetical protein
MAQATGKFLAGAGGLRANLGVLLHHSLHWRGRVAEPYNANCAPSQRTDRRALILVKARGSLCVRWPPGAGDTIV